jgi:hypothetical protein
VTEIRKGRGNSGRERETEIGWRGKGRVRIGRDREMYVRWVSIRSLSVLALWGIEIRSGSSRTA